ncbi:hypothetical protein FS749_015468 [Ceratobasidium sp. UAMH 11750]|nr:hypothetical protein FS749_015468 [Ceratobasidium sp. UAMH 11750]
MAALDLILGPILLGSFLNVLLCGILIAQVTWYFVVHKYDQTWIKLMVAWLLLLDILNSIFDGGFVYRYTITLFGDFGALGHSHWFFHVAPFMTSMIVSTTQCFFAWRITKLTGHAWIGWSIAAGTFIQLLAGIGTSVGGWIVVDFARFKELNAPITIWLAMSSATDIAITCVLSWYLHSNRTGFPHTDDVITKLIRSTIQTGFLTSLWAVIDLVLFLALPNNNLHLLFNLPLSKLYTNSLMSTLNARGGWDSGMSKLAGTNGSTNGISVHVSTVSEGDKSIGKSKSQPCAAYDRPSKFLKQTASEGDDSLELHDCAKPLNGDLEAGGGHVEARLRLSRTSEATRVGQDAKKQAESA